LNIPFTEDPGEGSDDTLTYTLKESKAPEGYEKSDDEFTITIKRGEPRVVTFPGGISKTMFPLVATVLRNGEEVDAGSITVVNNKIPDPIILSVKATKVLEGRELEEAEFDFALTDAEGEQVSEASNAADGSIEFKDIIVDQTGTYEYTIREIAGDDEEIEYDESSYNVTAKVVLNEDNILEVESISYLEGAFTLDTAKKNRFRQHG
jgi:pilin isopeptide linkage protein